MSLIRVRRERKKDWIDTKTGMSTGKLMALFFVVLLIIWYLSVRF
jgi:hypothetical protein